MYEVIEGQLTRITLPRVWDPNDPDNPEVFSNPTTLYVEGVQPSVMLRDIWMRLRYRLPDYVDCAKFFKLTVVEVDLDADSNNDGTIDPDDSSNGTDDIIEADDDRPGKILGVNDDYDEGKLDAAGSPLADLDDASPVSSDGAAMMLDDMVPCIAASLPPGDADAAITLTSTGGLVRVFAINPAAVPPYNQGEDWQLVPFGANLTGDYFLDGGAYYGWRWWIEGLAPGAGVLTLGYQGHGLTLEDEVRLTCTGSA